MMVLISDVMVSDVMVSVARRDRCRARAKRWPQPPRTGSSRRPPRQTLLRRGAPAKQLRRRAGSGRRSARPRRSARRRVRRRPFYFFCLFYPVDSSCSTGARVSRWWFRLSDRSEYWSFFLLKIVKCCTIKYYSEKSYSYKNAGKHEIRHQKSVLRAVFSIFSAKNVSST